MTMQEDNKQNTEIEVLKTKFENMKEQNASEHKSLSDTMKSGFSEVKELIRDFKAEADGKYASKITEKIVYGLSGAILLGALYAILNMIFK